MKRVYSDNNVAMVWHVRNMLQAQDIDVEVRNDRLYTVAGEVPVTECMAEVWVVNTLCYRLAERLIAEMTTDSGESLPDWQCPACGEHNAGSFALCWQCQHACPGESC